MADRDASGFRRIRRWDVSRRRAKWSARRSRIFVQGQGGGDIVTNNASLPVQAFLGIGSDQYFGGSNEDRVTGDSGQDTMFGNGGSDIPDGRADTGTAHGGLGTDVCVAGAETFCELD